MGDVKMADIYRKQALKKITDPDQLDRAITVSSPMSWLAIVGIAVIFAAVIIWGFVGSIPETVPFQGVVVSAEKIKEVVNIDSTEGNAVFCYAAVQYAPKIEAAAQADNAGGGRPAAKIYTFSDDKYICDAEIISVETPNVNLTNGKFFDKETITVVCKPVNSGKSNRAQAVASMSDGTLVQVKITTDTVKPKDKLFGGEG